MLQFGNNETFALIAENISNPDCITMYEQLFAIVKRDSHIILGRYDISKRDREDIIQEVQIAVATHLVPYYEKSANLSVQERNAWLRRIVENKRNDYLRKNIKHMLNTSIDELNSVADDERSNDCSTEKRAEIEERLFEQLKRVTRINTSAEKILAFFLNILSAVDSSPSYNGSPEQVSEEMSGKPIYIVYRETRRRLSMVLSRTIPDDVFVELERKVSISSDACFCMSAHAISDCTNWIRKKLRESSKVTGMEG